MSSPLRQTDPDVADAIRRETERQQDNLELIASENIVSEAVLEAQGFVLTNKYAEGLPGKRYYGGCEFVDQVERLAIERARALFAAEAANVQPHSGSQANMCVYFSQLQPGDTILAMNLSHGGHLTHGSPVNFSGRFFRVIPYGVRESDGRIDLEQVRELARRERPKMIVVGHSAYPRQIDFAAFRPIADEVGATIFADMAHFAGLVAAGLHPSPVPHCEFVTTTTHKTLRGPRGGLILFREAFAKSINASVFPGNQGGPLMHVIAAKAVALKEASTPAFKDYQRQILVNARALADGLMRRGFRLASGGTDNHLMLLDLRGTEMTGKVAEETLDKARITVNKNAVPFDPRPPFVTSGVRIGTPAVTSRGMREPEMEQIAELIRRGLEHVGDEGGLAALGDEVRDLCRRFPIYRRGFGSFGMRCPFCRDLENRVVDSRLAKEGDVIRRRRHCGRCGRRFTTYERVDEALPMVVKKDGRREPFDRQKIVNGLKRACEKRPISVDAIEAVVDRIEHQLQERGERELASQEIGEAVMRELHALDAVAYVRFASVYRSFRDVHEFMRELEDLIAERRAPSARRRTGRPAKRRSA